MIWSGGRVLSDEALCVSVRDRALEHGLGLFETLRTWAGRPALLGRHVDRLRTSAEALGIPIEPPALPDERAVAELLAAEKAEGDVLLRITASGGVRGDAAPVVWMRAGPLPPPVRRHGAVLALAHFQVAWDDPLARYKSLNYWARRLAAERALDLGADEALLTTPDGRAWEGSRTNLFLVRRGALTTPGLDGPIVPGVMRARVLELAAAIGIEAREAAPTLAEVDAADEVFLTNSVRGIVPVGRTPGRTLAAPGPVTARLQVRLNEALGAE
jgi:branched-subunit amino acid aminotransferase/4-amino-4-deoxychorismate lyase